MRKRSKYRPKGVRLDVMAWVKSGLMPINDVPHAAVNLRIRNHSALAAVTQGKATKDDIDDLVGAVNVTEALAMLGKGKDWADEIRAGQEAVLAMARRGLERGRFLFTGPELTAVNLAMEIHDAQLDACNVQELEQALDLVEKTIKHRKARVIA